jgi:hypothetical protein
MRLLTLMMTMSGFSVVFPAGQPSRECSETVLPAPVLLTGLAAL